MRNQKTNLAILLAVVAVTSTFALAEPGHEGHDHDHAKEAKPVAAKDDHAGHDHGAEPHADEVKLSDSAIRLSDIRIGTAEMKSLRPTFVAPARVAFNAEAMAHVGSVVSGRVIELKARVGDTVKTGNELLVVESPELGRAQSDYLQRRTDSEIAANAVAPLKDAADRARKLFDESQGIAFSEVQKREADARAARGAAASAKAALQAAENNLRLYGIAEDAVAKLVETGEINPRLSVRAPIGGQVIEREVTLGELVSPDKDALLRIADTSELWVIADVLDGRLVDVGVGSLADVQIASMPGVKLSGRVSFVASEIDAATRSARLRIVVSNKDGKLRPGLFAKATLQAAGDEAAAVVAVPEEAVQTVEGKPSVFVPVPGEANTFTPRAVAVGRSVGGFVPVTDGLKAGELLVISGSFVLKAELAKSEAGHQH